MLIETDFVLSCSAPRLFRRAAPYPPREEKAVELTDALGRYVASLGPGTGTRGSAWAVTSRRCRLWTPWAGLTPRGV